MNVLMINLGRQYGGAEKITEKIISDVDKLNYNIFLLCIKNSKLYNKNIVNYDKIKVLPKNKLLFIIYFPLCMYYIIKCKIDIIHCHGVIGMILGTICGKILNKKVITTVHGRADYDRDMSVKGILNDKLEKMLLNYNDKCISVSNYLNNYLIDNGVKENKTVVIYNDMEKKKEKIKNKDNDRAFENKKYSILSIGRLEIVKGHKFLIEAMGMAVKNKLDIECIIAGDGSQYKELDKLINEKSISNNVKLIGFVDNVSELFEDADLVVIPSLMESFGLAIIEAMREKKCIIASNVGGIPEIVEDGITGFLVKEGDSEELYNKINFCYNNKDKCKDIAAGAYYSYLNVWKNRKMVKDYQRLYNDLIRRK